jgi:LacI family transcriptional regulator
MNNKKINKINITDLAKKLNLSVSSVSRALNGHKNISEKTKVKILNLAKKYNYSPDLSAKRLASKKSDTIAFISTLTPYAPDYVLLEFLAGITLGIKDSSTELLIKFSLDEKDEINYYHDLISSKQADKFIFYRTKQKDRRIELLQSNNMNFVSWGRSKSYKDYAWIDMDNYKSIELLMNRLLKFGHKRIALINVHQSFNYGYQRKRAYEKILKENNLQLNKNYYQESLNGTTPNGIALTKFLLDLKKPPTAIICSLDKFFIGCLEECKNRNLYIGKDISVVGYNDHDNYLSSQNLTFISHPLSSMGQESVQILKNIERGEKPNNQAKLIEPILHEGKSDGSYNNT